MGGEELKLFPRCTKCNGGSKTELVNTVDGVFFKCLWCEGLSELSFNDVSNAVANKIKAEAYSNVSEILKYEFDGEYSEKGVGDFFDECANKLERGEL